MPKFWVFFRGLGFFHVFAAVPPLPMCASSFPKEERCEGGMSLAISPSFLPHLKTEPESSLGFLLDTGGEGQRNT